ncbi:helix-turn-helix domain-containing protein [Enterococcus pseudoavium]|uniref:helix-turn-helix domain-containing protein n=1 Tax=Enterococcus pseudoavium TaxID=44007 RepID=UPI00082D9536|nr:helix-turn-helix domain-containing protein [Enterococcus pseudoavium]
MNFREVLGTSSLRRLRFVELLYANQVGLPSDQLLEELECSLPILLKDVKLINDDQDDFHIEKFKGLYQIQVKPHVSINRLYADILQQSPEFQIIEELLYEKCSSISDLADKLYLSASNTQRYLKKIEMALKKAEIKLDYRPLRIEGKESVIRHFYYRYFLEKSDRLESLFVGLKDYQIKSITNLVDQFIQVNHLENRHIFRKRLSYNIYISLWRIKNQRFYPQNELASPLSLPDEATLEPFERMVLDVFRVRLTEEQIKDCLWLSYADMLVFSQDQWKSAMKQSRSYRDLYQKHSELVEEFNHLIGNSLSEAEVSELTIILVNDQRMYSPKGRYLDILYRQRGIFLEKMMETHYQAVKKVLKIAESFVKKYRIYQENDFIWNYTYLLITMVPKSLNLLANADQPLKILLLSELSPTEETFLADQIEERIYGNFKIHFVEERSRDSRIEIHELQKYDALITSSSVEEVPYDYPTVIIDPFLTSQNIVQLQQLISYLSD